MADWTDLLSRADQLGATRREQYAALRSRGVPVAVIARYYGVNKKAVYGRPFRRASVSAYPNQARIAQVEAMFRDGLSVTYIAADLQVSERLVYMCLDLSSVTRAERRERARQSQRNRKDRLKP